MGQKRETANTITRVAAAAITKNLLLSLDSADKLALCTATTRPMGQAMDTVDIAELIGCRLPADGIQELTAVVAISFRDLVYTAAGGKITNVAVDGSFLVGMALEASAADGDVIAVLPLGGSSGGFLVQDLPAVTTTTVNAGTANSGDATTDTVIDSIRTQLIALQVDVAGMRAAMVASGLFVT